MVRYVLMFSLMLKFVIKLYKYIYLNDYSKQKGLKNLISRPTSFIQRNGDILKSSKDKKNIFFRFFFK